MHRPSLLIAALALALGACSSPASYVVVKALAPGPVARGSGSVTAFTGLSGLAPFRDLCLCTPPEPPDVHLGAPSCFVDSETSLSIHYSNVSPNVALDAPAGNYTCRIFRFTGT